MSDSFDDIRAYYDHEVNDVIIRLLKNKELLDRILAWRFSKWPQPLFVIARPLLRFQFKRQLLQINSIEMLQGDYVSPAIEKLLPKASDSFTVTGLDKIDKNKSYVFISNHRDIIMDSTLLAYTLFKNNYKTCRNAVGDNLLKNKSFGDLLKLNKSFIVKRSIKNNRRKMFNELMRLSQYIWQSLHQDNESIWIAQREGRAKEGIDKTEAAIIKMLALYGKRADHSFSKYIKQLNIVPVVVSYEYDACDLLKAKERYHLEEDGSYIKAENEDALSMVQGILGKKGHIHLHIGDVLDEDYANASLVAEAIDQQITKNYSLSPINIFDYQQLFGKIPESLSVEVQATMSQIDEKLAYEQFRQRLATCPKAHQPYWLEMYANILIVKNKLLSLA